MKIFRNALFPIFALAVIFGFLAIPAKALGAYFSPFGQISVSLGLTSLVIFILARKTILSDLKYFDKKETLLIFLRSLSYYVFGAILYLYAFNFTTIATATFFQILPFLSIFGILFFGEKISKKFILVITSFLGSILMLIQINEVHGIIFDKGALLSTLSAIFITLSFLFRKYHSKKINDITLAFGTSFFASILTLIPGIFLGFEKFHFNLYLVFWVFLSVILNVGVVFFSNKAFRNVSAQTAGVILNLEPLIATLLGYYFFSEILSVQQLIGAGIIFFSVCGLAFFSKD